MRLSIVLIAKEPAGGEAKTRIGAVLGRAAACALAEAMLLDSLEAALRAAPPTARLVLCHAPADAGPRLRALGVPERVALVPQSGGGLGARLRAVTTAELAAGADACVVAAADSPFAITAIGDCIPRRSGEVVLAPCLDGGYWAVGLDRPAAIFDLPMSTAGVLEATVARARASGRSVRLLAPGRDLDLVEDLEAADRDGLLARAPRTAAAWRALRVPA